MLSFLSSTFVNMKEERNALQMDIVIPYERCAITRCGTHSCGLSRASMKDKQDGRVIIDCRQA